MTAHIKCPVHPRYEGVHPPFCTDPPCICSEIWELSNKARHLSGVLGKPTSRKRKYRITGNI